MWIPELEALALLWKQGPGDTVDPELEAASSKSEGGIYLLRCRQRYSAAYLKSLFTILMGKKKTYCGTTTIMSLQHVNISFRCQRLRTSFEDLARKLLSLQPPPQFENSGWMTDMSMAHNLLSISFLLWDEKIKKIKSHMLNSKRTLGLMSCTYSHLFSMADATVSHMFKLVWQEKLLFPQST